MELELGRKHDWKKEVKLNLDLVKVSQHRQHCLLI